MLIGVLVLLAFLTRLLPLSISSYPFNNDSLTECEIAVDIVETGQFELSKEAWYYDTHSALTPAYNVLLATVSSLIGVDVLDIAQIVTAVISVFSVIAGYLIAIELTGSRKHSLAVALTLSLFGTLVYLTGSSWKSALGFALLVFLVYAFMHRSERRILFVELIILGVLPLVHHLVMAIGYLSLGYLTIISAILAWRSGSAMRRQNLLDFTVMIVFSLSAFLYYQSGSLDKLSIILSRIGPINLAIAFAILCALSSLLLARERHLKFTLAPVVGIAVFVLFAIDRSVSLFGNGYSGPDMVLILAAAMSILVFVSWLGLERVQRSKSLHKVVPFALLLPVLTLFLIAVMNGLDLQAHQIFYRSFDFADLVLALGIGFALKGVRDRPMAEFAMVGVLICTLLITFPFAYASGTLIGVRHDTQAYEVDAIEWLQEGSSEDVMLQSDERLGYIALALFDIEKAPFLPNRLVSDDPLLPTWFYLYEEEWSNVGVNNYPSAYVVVDPREMSEVLHSSDTYYIGGPSVNNVIVFSWSSIGYSS